mgnify:CR=1 FL=1
MKKKMSSKPKTYKVYVSIAGNIDVKAMDKEDAKQKVMSMEHLAEKLDGCWNYQAEEIGK